MDASSRQRPALYLIDGHAQFFRAYYAIRSGLSSPVTNEPTNLTYGFVGMLLKLLREHRPEYLAVVIDVSGDRESFRSELYPEYKANRDATPEDFHPQVERCLEILRQMHIPVLGEAGVEADDVIATLARRLEREHEDLDIEIVSRDKDLAQLLTDRVRLFDPYKDDHVTPGAIFKTEGVLPEHVVDVLALMGDNVDNIPGVDGIGPKTAAQLVIKYGSIDGILEHIDEIKGKRRQNIEAARDRLPLNRQLVLLRDDVPVDFDLESARTDAAAYPAETLAATFRELGFNRHVTELQSLVAAGREPGDDPSQAPGDHEPAQFSEGLFAQDGPPNAEPRDPGAYDTVTTVASLDAVIESARRAGLVAVDTETDALSSMTSNLCGIALSVAPRTGVYVPVRSPAPDTHLSIDEVVARLAPLLEDEDVAKIGHNLKFDMNVLRRHGVQLAGPLNDTMIASYVVDATRSSHGLDALAHNQLGHICTPISDLIGKGRHQKGFDEVPLDRAAPYAAEDADVTMRLWAHFEPKLDDLGLRRLYDEVEMPLVGALARMEHAGVRVDADELDRQRAQLGERIETLRAEMAAHAPAMAGFNPDSPKQLANVLFNGPDDDPPGLGLKVVKKTKTGRSTDQEVLERLAGDPEIDCPLPRLVLEYRQLTKLVSTYLVALKEAINPATGRVHASFNQTVAATGRLSSSDPNLQNIPIRTDVGRQIRRAFVAEPGYVLITADYSQIELRLLAHLADDPALIEAFRDGADIHTAVAAEVFGVAPEAVEPSQRDSAKMVNFGIIYGITPFGLARRLGPDVSVETAAALIEGYKQRYDRIDAFLERCVAEAITDGYVATILGRRRAIPQVGSRNPAQRALGRRMAINSVVQGSAADLIKVAMIDLDQRLPATHPQTRIVLQIHDELVFESPEERVAEVSRFVVDRMEAAMDLAVPLVVESAWSQRWIDAK